MHACVFVEEGCVSVTPAFVVSALTSPPRRWKHYSLHALIITHTAADAHIRQTDRQTGSGLGISALCVPSSAVFSRSVSLSLCFDVACACQQRACAIISARGAGRPLSLPTVKCRWRWTVYPHTAKFRSDVLPQYFFLAKCIGM